MLQDMHVIVYCEESGYVLYRMLQDYVMVIIIVLYDIIYYCIV